MNNSRGIFILLLLTLMVFSVGMVSGIDSDEVNNTFTGQVNAIDSSCEIVASDSDSNLDSPTQGTVYVSKTGNDSNNGSTKEKALASLTYALTVVPNNGNIVMLEGQYSYSSISIPSSKIVTIEGEGNVNLTSTSSYYAFITNEGELTLKNMNIVNHKGDMIDSAAFDNKNKLTVVNSTFINNKLLFYNNGDLLIDNSSFFNSLGCVVNADENAKTTTVTNSKFINGKYGNSILSFTKTKYATLIENCTFENFYSTANGGGIVGVSNIGADFRINNCRFINNTLDAKGMFTPTSDKWGVVIRVGLTTDVLFEITKCVFVNNKGINGAIGVIQQVNSYINVTHSVFINNSDYYGYTIVNGGSRGTSIYDYNWWGSDNPNFTTLVNDTRNPVNKWAILDMDYTPSTNIGPGSTVKVVAGLTKYKDVNGTINPLVEKLPDYGNVTFEFQDGTKTVAPIENASAKVDYLVKSGENIIKATLNNQTVNVIIEAKQLDTIFVSENGNDINEGSELSPVKTIARAIQLASSGKIIILPGNYIENNLVINNNLTITGRGNVVIDGNASGVIFTINAGNNVYLSNLNIKNAVNTKNGGAIYNNGANLYLNSVNLYENIAANGGAIYNTNKGSVVISNSKLYKNNNTVSSGWNKGGSAIYNTGASKVTIENSEIYQNNALADGTIQSYNGDLTIKNSKFFNNTAIWGSAFYGENANIIVDNSNFYNNKANNAVLYVRTSTLNVTNSIIRSNSAINYPSAINNYGSKVTIDNATIVNNTNTKAAIINQDFSTNTAFLNITNSRIYNNTNGGFFNDKSYSLNSNITLNIFNCAIFNNGDSSVIQHGTKTNDIYVTANTNWWGSNKNPTDIVGEGVTLDNWIIFQVNYEDRGIPVIYDQFDIEANLNYYVTKDGKNATILNNHVFDGLVVNFNTTTGYLTKNNAVISNGIAISKYSVLTQTANIIVVKFDNQTITLDLNKNYYNGTTYVSTTGKDTNDGSKDFPVASLEKALTINKNGNIVILNGTYNVMDVKINGNYNITGEGSVTLSGADISRILYILEGKVIIKNINFTNGRILSESGALIGNAGDLTLINTTLSNSKSNKNGGAIYNVGNLVIINATIANNKATVGGAIFIDKFNYDTCTIKFQNVVFEDNEASGDNNHAGGAIYAQAIGGEILIDNCSFISNSISGNFAGGAIHALQLADGIKITNSRFINNSANSPENYGGGAICYIGGNTEKMGILNITDSVFEDNKDNIAGAIYIRGSTLDISYSALINNGDIAIYKGISSYVTTTVTANNNWWGTNNNPSAFTNGVSVSKWIVMTFTNNTPLIQANKVLLTVTLDTLNDGSKLDKTLVFTRPLTIITPTETFNNQYSVEYTIPQKVTIIVATIDNQSIYLYSTKTNTTLNINDTAANVGRNINLTAIIKDMAGNMIPMGVVEYYINDKLVGNTNVKNGISTLILSNNYPEGNYNITAKYMDSNGVYTSSMNKATLKVISTSLIVTNSTFFNFFDENGLLKSGIDANELIFSGLFSNLGVNTITIDRSIKLKGTNSTTLNEIYLELIGNDIVVDNFTVNTNKKDYGIYTVNAMNVTIKNSLINFNDSALSDAIAIYADGVSNLQLINNTVNYIGQSKGKTLNHPLHIDNCTGAIIENNTINAKMPSLAIDYDRITFAATTYSAAVFIDNSDDISVLNNKVTNTYNGFNGMYDTIEGILIRASNNPVVKSNIINVTGHNYTYALKFVSVMGKDYNVYGCLNIDAANNIINSKCDYYHANAIEVDGPTSGKLFNNSVVVEALDVVYGIYSQAINGAVSMNYINNTIVANANTAYAMELMGNDETVTGNNITSKGNFTMGIISSSKNLKVFNNVINSLGSGIGTITGGDVLGGENTGIIITGTKYSVKYSKLEASNNTIITTGEYSIIIDNRSTMLNTVTNNYLVSNKSVGDGSVNASQSNKVYNNTPDKYPAFITAKDNVLFIDNNYTITLTDIYGKALAGMDIIIKCEDKIWKEVTDEHGNVSVSVSDLSAGNHLIEVIFEGTKYYDSSNLVNNLTINKYPTVINLTSQDVFVGFNATIIAEINVNVTGEIIFIFNNKEYPVSIINSKTIFSIANLASGTYDVVAKYNGNELYASSIANTTFRVNKYPSDIKVDINVKGDDVYVDVVLPKDATGNVSVIVGDKKQSSIVSNGSARVVINNLASGNYSVEITYSGDKKYDSASLIKNITVIPMEFKLSINELIKFQGGKDKLTATLIDGQGNPIVNASIVFTVNGVDYTRYTNVSGIASMAINLKAGSYNASATYNDTIANTTITIKSTTIGQDIVKMFRNETQYSALFLDSDGNPLANSDVKFNINGVFYIRTTNDKGVASLNIQLLPKEYIITNYNPVTGEENSNKVTVKSLLVDNKDLTKYYLNESKYNLRVIGKDGKLAAGQEVTFNINGVFYKRVSDENAIVSLAINLRPGKYIVTAEYEGCSVSNNINVLDTLITKDLDMKYLDGSKFSAQTLDGQGNPLANQNVSFNVNGVFYYKTTGEDGIAELNIRLNPGKYIITSIWNEYQIGNKITIA